MTPEIEVLVEPQCELAEGPIWHPGSDELTWADVISGEVLARTADGTVKAVASLADSVISAAIPRKQGGYLIATTSGLLTGGADGWQCLSHPEQSTHLRYNDGKCDARGRFWVGSMMLRPGPTRGSLWRIDPCGTARQMDTGFGVANGLGWSPDNTFFYLVDSETQWVYRYQFDEGTGELSNRKVWIDCKALPGKPDGLTVDGEGNLWVAHWDGGCITVHSPTGKLLQKVELPVPRPTSCTISPAGHLIVTTARYGLTVEQLHQAPASGGLLQLDLGAMPGEQFFFGN